MTAKNLKHRSVIEIQMAGDISQEPEMQELTRLFQVMTESERDKTEDYLEHKIEETEKRGGRGVR